MDGVSENGRLWAVVSYGSFFVGVPLFLGPLLLRDDAYALRHAKMAGEAWAIAWGGAIAITVVIGIVQVATCGLLGWVLIPAYAIPMVWSVVLSAHGALIALNGEETQPLGVLGIGENLLSGVQPKLP